MPVINGTQIDAEGTAKDSAITVKLRPATASNTSNEQIVPTDITITPSSGVWSVTLEPTDEMSCSDAHYLFTFSDGTRKYKLVPATPDPVDFDDLADYYL
jgi:hypothetical protein